METEFFAEFKVILKGRALTALSSDEVIAYSGDAVSLGNHFFYSPLADGSGVEKGWVITMHEDAQVELEYLYRPDVRDQPTLALQQPEAPKPLVFKSSGWFSETIDKELLMPVRKPE